MVKLVCKTNLYKVEKFSFKKHLLIRQTQIVLSMFRERKTANYRAGRLPPYNGKDHSHWNNIIDIRQFARWYFIGNRVVGWIGIEGKRISKQRIM